MAAWRLCEPLFPTLTRTSFARIFRPARHYHVHFAHIFVSQMFSANRSFSPKSLSNTDFVQKFCAVVCPFWNFFTTYSIKSSGNSSLPNLQVRFLFYLCCTLYALFLSFMPLNTSILVKAKTTWKWLSDITDLSVAHNMGMSCIEESNSNHCPSCLITKCDIGKEGRNLQNSITSSRNNIQRGFQMVRVLLTLFSREYGMIYRGPGLLSVVWGGGSSPNPSPLSCQ